MWQIFWVFLSAKSYAELFNRLDALQKGLKMPSKTNMKDDFSVFGKSPGKKYALAAKSNDPYGSSGNSAKLNPRRDAEPSAQKWERTGYTTPNKGPGSHSNPGNKGIGNYAPGAKYSGGNNDRGVLGSYQKPDKYMSSDGIPRDTGSPRHVSQASHSIAGPQDPQMGYSPKEMHSKNNGGGWSNNNIINKKWDGDTDSFNNVLGRPQKPGTP
jgi:hypothetical protein